MLGRAFPLSPAPASDVLWGATPMCPVNVAYEDPTSIDTSEVISTLAGRSCEAASKQGLDNHESSCLIDVFFMEEMDLSLPYVTKPYHNDGQTKKQCSDDHVLLLKKQCFKKKKKPHFLHVVQTF